MISAVLLPTAMFTESPLWCSPCLDKEHCGGRELGVNQSRQSDGGWWVNKYCLMNQVGIFFPITVQSWWNCSFQGWWGCPPPPLLSDHGNDASVCHRKGLPFYEAGKHHPEQVLCPLGRFWDPEKQQQRRPRKAIQLDRATNPIIQGSSNT